MKTILCFGDSITHGYIPGSMDMETFAYQRFTRNQRYAGIMQQQLSEQYEVIESGLIGRTLTNDDDMLDFNCNGSLDLIQCLNCYRPLDYVVLFLGSNDCKPCFNLTAEQICENLEKLCELSMLELTHSQQLILVSPPLIETVCEQWRDFFKGASEKSKQLAALYKKLAQQRDHLFIDAAESMTADAIDGIHPNQQGQYDFGLALAALINDNKN